MNWFLNFYQLLLSQNTEYLVKPWFPAEGKKRITEDLLLLILFFKLTLPNSKIVQWMLYFSNGLYTLILTKTVEF